MLELNTPGHALCTIIIYCLWWNKPLDIDQPDRINFAPSLNDDRHTSQLIAAMCCRSKLNRSTAEVDSGPPNTPGSFVFYIKTDNTMGTKLKPQKTLYRIDSHKPTDLRGKALYKDLELRVSLQEDNVLIKYVLVYHSIIMTIAPLQHRGAMPLDMCEMCEVNHHPTSCHGRYTCLNPSYLLCCVSLRSNPVLTYLVSFTRLAHLHGRRRCESSTQLYLISQSILTSYDFSRQFDISCCEKDPSFFSHSEPRRRFVVLFATSPLCRSQTMAVGPGA